MATLNIQQLRQIMPHLTQEKAAYFLPFLLAAMDQYQINTPRRIAAFLSQLAHESGELKYWAELWGPTDAQRHYEGRRDLGNTQPGDGFQFRGRGPIQITGRANYERYGRKLGVDLISQPELLQQPEYGFKAAAAYWDAKNLNAYADVQTEAAFKEITKAINGGLNGYANRLAYYSRALRALHPPEPEPPIIDPQIVPLTTPQASEPAHTSPESLAAVPTPVSVSVKQEGDAVVTEVRPAEDVTAHVSDSKKSVIAGVSASTVITGLVTAGKFLGAHAGEISTAIICITVLAGLFIFRQLILAAIREWLKGQGINT